MRSYFVSFAVVITIHATSCNKQDHSTATTSAPNDGTGTPVTKPPPLTPVVAPKLPSVPDKWWENATAHCPRGTSLQGKTPPEGHSVWCADDDYKRSGPRTNWHRNGKLSSQGWEQNSERAGYWQHWHDNGQLRLEETRLPNDAITGKYSQWKADGSLVGSYEIVDGSGLVTRWYTTGEIFQRGSQKDGVRIGVWEDFHKNGKVSRRYQMHGKAHGKSTSFNKEGQRVVEGTKEQGKRVGPWTYYDGPTQNIVRVDTYRDDSTAYTSYYQDGVRLGPKIPDLSKCDSDDDVSSVVEAATGRRLSKRYGCIDRAKAFPGLIIIGSFAHDRGCEPTSSLMDCKYIKGMPSSRDILARAGWQQANATSREAIAKRYIKQVATTFRGSLSSKKPAPPDIKAQQDGSVIARVWIRRPSGMTPETVRDLVEYRISADGDVARKLVETRTERR